ncbi:hypothetical protein BABINDRAFT_160668 [Babjeviella inositovora NRRL Y-12698]|uniref:U3 small nucleolar ribonucleoprotein protein MPP10 n=1 Tax=Babjeviella inositovora NRRL Y-12698 TaxID=984486 RepID=A0A1E3QUD9_9ASCO|nr:uncharacterized protein BABINDRAFT_160668 [Babjeviella inositovora NRRL Y-12698]ODQ81306.1 hypothetical protein BABINDRAFT_160668 [Babjeviella inositovora NRRL Y-12698]
MSSTTDILDLFTEDPTAVFAQSVESQDSVLQTIKQYLDPVIKANTDAENQQRSIIDEIYVDGLDSSQVWGQAKLIIDDVSENLLSEKIPELKALFSVEFADEEESGEESAEGSGLEDLGSDEELGSEEELEGSEDDLDVEGGLEESQDELEESEAELDVKVPESEEETVTVTTTAKKDAFGLNDDFFDIDEFNRQTLAAENMDDNQEDDGIDMFGDLSDSDEDDVAYFNDFFDKPNEQTKVVAKKSKKAEEEEEEEFDFNEDDYDNAMNGAMMDLFADEDTQQEPAEENMSSFQKHQKLIQEEITKLEEEAVAVKKWSMRGEAKARDRPMDSLLEEELEFERTAKPVPVITKESTESLEEMIRRRIKAEEWDDLPRRVVTDLKNFRSSNRFELSETKSSKSLAQLYEDDYQNATGATTAPSAASDELTKAHEEITAMYQSLSHKLDALCSAHFVPKPQQKSLEVKVNTNAIAMEDAQPLTGSTTQTLAPQEIYNPTDARGLKTGNGEIKLKSGLVMSKDELSRDDKQRLRRAVKRKRGKEVAEKAIAAKQSGTPATKKSKTNDVIETLANASNITVVGKKGEMRDVKGNLKKGKVQTGSSGLKL